MKTVWRSRFWNIVLALGLTEMAAVCTAVAVLDRETAVEIGSGLSAALLWTAAVRAVRRGVYARLDGLTVRSLSYTVKLRWEQIEAIDTGVIWRRTAGAPARRTELAFLGSYEVARRSGQSLTERAMTDLGDRLAGHRGANPEAETHKCVEAGPFPDARTGV
jgi:hypothetical protein